MEVARIAPFGVGDTSRVVDLDGILILTPMVTMVSELARETARARLASGLSVEELRGARRERYYQENYGDAWGA